MDTFVRNALRLSLAGAGIVVLGASYVGQASADESPEPASDTTSPSTSEDSGAATTDTSESPLAVPTLPAPQYLLSPDSLDSFVLPTVTDLVPPELG